MSEPFYFCPTVKFAENVEQKPHSLINFMSFSISENTPGSF